MAAVLRRSIHGILSLARAVSGYWTGYAYGNLQGASGYEIAQGDFANHSSYQCPSDPASYWPYGTFIYPTSPTTSVTLHDQNGTGFPWGASVSGTWEISAACSARTGQTSTSGVMIQTRTIRAVAPVTTVAATSATTASTATARMPSTGGQDGTLTGTTSHLRLPNLIRSCSRKASMSEAFLLRSFMQPLQSGDGRRCLEGYVPLPISSRCARKWPNFPPNVLRRIGGWCENTEIRPLRRGDCRLQATEEAPPPFRSYHVKSTEATHWPDPRGRVVTEGRPCVIHTSGGGDGWGSPCS